VFGPYKNIIGDAAIKIRDNGTTLDKDAAGWLTKYVKDRYNIAIAAKTR